MTITKITGFVRHEPARGRIYSGVVNVLLTGYVKGTGFTLDASAFNLSKLVQIMIQPVDCGGLWLFDWDPATEVLTILDRADGAEIENDEADGDNIRVMYWGF